MSYDLTVPVYWQVDAGSYGTTKSWAGFAIEPCNLIKTSTGKSLLYLEVWVSVMLDCAAGLLNSMCDRLTACHLGHCCLGMRPSTRV